MAITVQQLRENLNQSLQSARIAEVSEEQKMLRIAEVLAYFRELSRVEENGGAVDIDEVNRNLRVVLDGSALKALSRRGLLGELAAMTPQAMNQRVRALEAEIGRYPAGNAEDAAAAGNIFAQMDRTWRVSSNSAEYREALQAMRDISNGGGPSQTDNYLAAESLKKYIQKNVNKAKSTVGKTRMACSLAFLKKTMSEQDFRAYCSNLNGLRRVTGNIAANGVVEFDRTNPRAIIPEEIGTIREVYNAARERISLAAQENRKPAPRDLAMLTALKAMEAKNRSRGGANLIVEHESLQEEIEKVMKDPRFANAIANRPADELCEMGFGGNIDTLQGYAAPLRPEQQERVDAARDQQEADRREGLRNQLNEKQRAWEAEEKKIADARMQKVREAEEARRKEQERIRKEQEEQKFLKEHKSVTEMLRELLPTIARLDRSISAKKKEEKPKGDLVDDAFELLNEKKEPKPTDHMVEDLMDEILNDTKLKEKDPIDLTATLIAIGEGQKNTKMDPKYPDKMLNIQQVKKRAAQLKKDPIVKEMAKNLQKVYQEGVQNANKTNYSEDNVKLYPAVYMSAFLLKDYRKKVKTKERLDKMVIADYYKSVSPKTDALFRQEKTMNVKTATNLAGYLVALHEFEVKNGGVNAHVDVTAFRKRREELKKDPVIQQMGKDLMEPAMQKQLQRTVVMMENREHAFGEMLDNMYQDLTAQKNAQTGPKKPEENNAPQPGNNAPQPGVH